MVIFQWIALLPCQTRSRCSLENIIRNGLSGLQVFIVELVCVAVLMIEQMFTSLAHRVYQGEFVAPHIGYGYGFHDYDRCGIG